MFAARHRFLQGGVHFPYGLFPQINPLRVLLVRVGNKARKRSLIFLPQTVQPHQPTGMAALETTLGHSNSAQHGVADGGSCIRQKFVAVRRLKPVHTSVQCKAAFLTKIFFLNPTTPGASRDFYPR